jgi:hypothetical protein
MEAFVLIALLPFLLQFSLGLTCVDCALHLLLSLSVNTVFREFTNIDGKACNNITEAANTLTLSAHLDHSCETDYSKQIHSFITG